MKRIHAFEIHDQFWCPDVFRNQLTEFLQLSAKVLRIYDGVIPLVEKVLLKTGSNEIVDLCSGSSGPWSHLAEKTSGIKVVLTDKYPNTHSLERVSLESDGKIKFVSESVDATNVPAHLTGMRTIFTGLHHFRTEMAKLILEDAVQKRTPIGIFEFTERSLYNLLSGPLGYPLLVLLLSPFVKPFKMSRLFWEYVLPVAPLVALWDGVVSDLRTYSVIELEELVSSIESTGYKWEVGVQKASFPGMRIMFGDN